MQGGGFPDEKNLYALKSNSVMMCRDHLCRKESEQPEGHSKTMERIKWIDLYTHIITNLAT